MDVLNIENGLSHVTLDIPAQRTTGGGEGNLDVGNARIDPDVADHAQFDD
jgi:hypothetical protein